MSRCWTLHPLDNPDGTANKNTLCVESGKRIHLKDGYCNVHRPSEQAFEKGGGASDE